MPCSVVRIQTENLPSVIKANFQTSSNTVITAALHPCLFSTLMFRLWQISDYFPLFCQVGLCLRSVRTRIESQQAGHSEEQLQAQTAHSQLPV